MRESMTKARAKSKLSKNKIELGENYETIAVKIAVPGKKSISNEIPLALISKPREKTINHIKYILDADIEGCFNNIDHNWLLE